MELITNTKDFASLVRQRRHELGLSQVQLAEQVGVSRQWIIDMEKGKPRAELALALALLQALKLQINTKKINESQYKKDQIDIEKNAEKVRDLANAFDFLNK